VNEEVKKCLKVYYAQHFENTLSEKQRASASFWRETKAAMLVWEYGCLG
jgi:hypothetical protein